MTERRGSLPQQNPFTGRDSDGVPRSSCGSVVSPPLQLWRPPPPSSHTAAPARTGSASSCPEPPAAPGAAPRSGCPEDPPPPPRAGAPTSFLASAPLRILLGYREITEAAFLQNGAGQHAKALPALPARRRAEPRGGEGGGRTCTRCTCERRGSRCARNWPILRGEPL